MKNYFKNEIKNKNDELIVFNSLCSKVVDDKNVLGKLIKLKKETKNSTLYSKKLV
jgi:hypothetical protein